MALNPQEKVIIDALSAEGQAVSYRAFVQKLNETGRANAVKVIDGLRVGGKVKVELGLLDGMDKPAATIRLPEHPKPSYVPEGQA